MNCGSKSENYFNGVESLEVFSVSTLEEAYQNRYGSSLTSNQATNFFGLKLNVMMAEEKLLASNFSGYSCFACSLAPAYMASNIEGIRITFSESFLDNESGDNLREYFVIDPFDSYTTPFQFMSLDRYERATGTNRTANQIYFLYNDSLKQNIEGIFTIDLVADGIPFKAESEFVTINLTN